MDDHAKTAEGAYQIAGQAFDDLVLACEMINGLSESSIADIYRAATPEARAVVQTTLSRLSAYGTDSALQQMDIL